jgi:dolichol kinase
MTTVKTIAMTIAAFAAAFFLSVATLSTAVSSGVPVSSLSSDSVIGQ